VIERLNTASGKLRAVTAAAAIAVTSISAALYAGAPAAWADGTTSAGSAGSAGAGAGAGGSGGSSESALQVQAQELAAQIQADGRRLDQMAEAVNAAQLRSQQLASQLAGVQADMAQSQAKAAAARAALKQQAVISYVVGGAPAVSSIPNGPQDDPSLAISYAEIVTGGQRRALDAYREALAEQSTEAQQVLAAQRDASVNLQQLEAARSSAAQADASRRQALAQVTGQLAVLVAQIQAAQQAAARNAILTSAGPATSGPPATAPAPTTTTRPTPGPTTRQYNPPATQPVSSGSPRTTVAPPPPTTAPASSGGASGGSTPGVLSPQAPGANKAIAYARAQLGKPYQWAGAGPDSFDCSGLTMMAWEQAGVYFPHLAQDQYDMTQRESIAQALPGDLIFFGTPTNVYHVGLYIGNGQMIDAPETGQNVSIQSIYWSNLLGAGRVTG
jgi:cell wall-associated NlpC family hydrolase